MTASEQLILHPCTGEKTKRVEAAIKYHQSKAVAE